MLNKGDFGIKIAKKGYNIYDTDNHLVYNSKYPLLKILAKGSGEATLDSTSGYTATLYTHNLGYSPMFQVQVEYIDAQSGIVINKKRICSWRDYYGLGIYWTFRAYTDTTKLYLEITTTDDTTYEDTVLKYDYVIYYDEL